MASGFRSRTRVHFVETPCGFHSCSGAAPGLRRRGARFPTPLGSALSSGSLAHLYQKGQARLLMRTRCELHEERMDLRVADIFDRVGQGLPI